MARPTCTICAHSDRVRIDSGLQAGLKISEVAAQFSVSKDALRRHRIKCLAGSLKPKDDSLESQIRVWLARANDLFAVSGADRDLRGQATAITQALRALEFLALHQNELNEEKRQLPHDPQLWTEDEAEKFRAYLDWCVAKAARASYASDEVKRLAVGVIQ